MSGINSSISIVSTAGDPSNFPLRITARDGSLLSWIDDNGFPGGNLSQGMGGGGTPAGSTGDIQFNNNGVFSNAPTINSQAVAVLSADGNVTIQAPGRFVLTSVSHGITFDAGGSEGLALIADSADISVEANQNIILTADNAGITLGASNGFIQFNAPVTGFGGGINAPELQVFANNAAAISGGLGTGDFYRTGADPDVVCVVH